MISTPSAGQVLEILDSESGVWRLGRCMQIVDDDQYRIHYEGWSSNFDETVRASRVRVQRPLGALPSKRRRTQTSKISDDQPPIKPKINLPVLVKDDEFYFEANNGPIRGIVIENDPFKERI